MPCSPTGRHTPRHAARVSTVATVAPSSQGPDPSCRTHQSAFHFHSLPINSAEWLLDKLVCRRDSFITHHAFCDTLAEDAKARAPSPEDGSSTSGGLPELLVAPAPLQQLPPAPAHVPQREEQGTRRIPEGFWGLLESCYNRFYSRVDFPGRSFDKISVITRSYLAACR